MFKNKLNLKTKIILWLIIIFGFTFRLIGLSWDQNQHLHPDERFLTMVVSSINLPQNIFDYFSTSKSSFNPANSDYSFYVYGTFPLLITRFFSQILNLTSYDQIFLIGRLFSALFDTSVIFLVFLISLRLFKTTPAALFSSFLYSVCIFPIQQSHFFTVDSITVFLFTLTVFLLISHQFNLSGFIFGITLASKTSVGIILPFFLLYIFIQKNKFSLKIINCLVFGLLMCLSFRIFQPYAFTGFLKISPDFLSNIRQAHQMITGKINYPPNIQWKSTLPIIHSLLNLIYFGISPVSFTLILLGFYQIFKTKTAAKNPQIILLSVTILTIFIYHSVLLAKYMRYFYPIYPLLIVFAGYSINLLNKKFVVILSTVNIFISLAFLNIYFIPHSRYQASEWICQNISSNTVLSSESWDDSLPLNSPSCQSVNYPHQDLNLFDPESLPKWDKISQQLNSVDYLILSSNRLWGSIPKDHQDYSQSINFYQDLFDGNSSFKLIKKFYSYPGFQLPFLHNCILIGPSVYPYKNNRNISFEVDKNCSYPGIYFRDDFAEESFTVYDHPQVLIFKKSID